MCTTYIQQQNIFDSLKKNQNVTNIYNIYLITMFAAYYNYLYHITIIKFINSSNDAFVSNYFYTVYPEKDFVTQHFVTVPKLLNTLQGLH